MFVFLFVFIIIVSFVWVAIFILIKVGDKEKGDYDDPEKGFGVGDQHWTRRLKKENEELKKENEELKKQLGGDNPGDDYTVLCCTTLYYTIPYCTVPIP